MMANTKLSNLYTHTHVEDMFFASSLYHSHANQHTLAHAHTSHVHVRAPGLKPPTPLNVSASAIGSAGSGTGVPSAVNCSPNNEPVMVAPAA
jgi:hypothetical protein